MNPGLLHRLRHFRRLVLLMIVGLTIVETTGCLSLMNSRAKSKASAAREKFSCGESLPARDP